MPAPLEHVVGALDAEYELCAEPLHLDTVVVVVEPVADVLAPLTDHSGDFVGSAF